MSEAASCCIWCGEALKRPGASKCAGCGLWQQQAQCRVCGHPMPADATYCTECKYVRAVVYKNCRVCSARMPEDADRCNACSSFQDWRRHVPHSTTTLALLTALVTALSPALQQLSNVMNRHSDTSFIVSGATPQFITLTVANTGRSASLLRSFRLTFDGLPLEDVELRVILKDQEEGRMYIAPGTKVVHVRASGVAQTGRLTKLDIAKLLTIERTITLTVQIKESDDPANGPWTEVPAVIPAAFLRPYLLEAILDD
jgi:hypothetical protein